MVLSKCCVGLLVSWRVGRQMTKNTVAKAIKEMLINTVNSSAHPCNAVIQNTITYTKPASRDKYREI